MPEVLDRKASIGSARCREARTSTATSVIRHWPHAPTATLASGVARAPQAPRPRGGPRGWRGPPGARLKEVVAVTSWPGAQTSSLRGGPKIVATPLTLAWHSQSGEVQNRPSRLQVPPRIGFPVPLRLLRPGASIVHPLLPAFSPVSGASSHRPSNEN